MPERGLTPHPRVKQHRPPGVPGPILRLALDLVLGVRDRRVIDALLADTHILYAGAISGPHRGELCYVARSAFPSPDHLAAEEIRVEGGEET